jgi:hypothetical protein
MENQTKQVIFAMDLVWISESQFIARVFFPVDNSIRAQL